MRIVACNDAQCEVDHGLPRHPARDVVKGGTADVLEEIASPGVAASIWQRPLPEALTDWLAVLTVGEMPRLRTTVPLHLVESAVIEACEDHALEESPGRGLFCQDIAALGLAFGKLMKVREVLVRLDVATDAQCPKFHIDQVEARLLCSYLGKGTEYVRSAHVEERARHRQMTTGAVGLFRGGLWNSGEPCDILHRSPEMTEGDQPRLLLVMDPVR